MADSAAVRVRRSRAHKKDDHSLCLPGRCEQAPAENARTRGRKQSRDAKRAMRYRKHKSGDHSMCLPGNCVSVTEIRDVTLPELQDVTGAVDRLDLPFGESGRRIWAAITSRGDVGPLQRPLLVEACRIADRLDTLDRQLHGEAWLRFRHDESGAEVTVYVDRALAEAREQATALKGIVSELVKHVGKAEPEKTKGGGVLADLAARRAARGAQTAG